MWCRKSCAVDGAIWRGSDCEGALNNLLRLASCAGAVLGIFMYAGTLRFLRSVLARPAFARYGFIQGSVKFCKLRR